MKNPHFVNFRVWPDHGERDPAELILSKTGRNTGNLMFISALHRVVVHDVLSASMRFDWRTLRERHDGLVIPAANWLSNHSDWGKLAVLIERSKLPCVMVGLGAQSASTAAMPKLSEGTFRLVKVVSERSHSISVRGSFSAEVLEHYGIKNVNITGCPSLLWHVDRPAFVDPQRRSVERISICATREDTLASLADSSRRNQLSLTLTRLAYRRHYDFVAQTERHDINIARGVPLGAEHEQEAMAYLCAAYAESDPAAIRHYLATHLKVFCDPTEWIRYMQGRDCVVGTRLHGVIAGLLAGIPGILVAHDTRTNEMAQHLAIPSVPAALMADGDLDMSRLLAAADPLAFNARMKTYYQSFRAFFAENKVAVNLREIS